MREGGAHQDLHASVLALGFFLISFSAYVLHHCFAVVSAFAILVVLVGDLMLLPALISSFPAAFRPAHRTG